MTSTQLLDWIASHATAAWPIISAALILVLRSRTPEQWVALGERSPRVQGVVRLLRAVGLDPAKAVSALVQIVTARVPSRPVAEITPPSPSKVVPVDHRGERGSVRVGTLVAISGAMIVAVAVVVGGALLTGCPRLPPVAGCTPRAYRCTDTGRPEVCSSTQRWEPIGDEPCSASGAVCVVDRTAHCALPALTDGGTDAR